MHNRMKAFLAVGLGVTGAWGQAQEPGKSGTQVSRGLLDRAKVAAAAQNRFGTKLLADENGHNPQRNVFLSPLSIFLALAMTESGSAGTTRTAMRDTLTIPATLSENEFQEAASALSQSLRSRKDIDLSIANALWSDKNFRLADGFVQRARDYYEAEAAALDFHNPEAAQTINQWVSRNTRGKIPDIVTPEVVRKSVAILTNAVYFHGLWAEPFSKSLTQDSVFHRADGGQRNVPMMHQERLLRSYRSGDGFEAARLPYQSSGLALYAILPASGTNPEQAMTKVSVADLIRGNDQAELDLRLPRFTLNYSATLKDPLSRMGMGIAFHYPGADFGPMGSSKIFIGEVIHKTRLEVDEEGTVAAAVTGVTMAPLAVRPQPREKKTLVFDRPFALIICDETTGAALFTGVIYDPGK